MQPRCPDGTVASKGIDVSFLAAFLAGVLSISSPCVLPLVPIFLAHLAGASATGVDVINRRRVLPNAIAYVLGFSRVFIALGVALGAAGALVSTASVVASNRDWLTRIGGALLILLGLPRGWRGNRSAVILLVAFGAVIFTYFGHYVFGGLHAYGGVWGRPHGRRGTARRFHSKGRCDNARHPWPRRGRHHRRRGAIRRLPIRLGLPRDRRDQPESLAKSR